MKFHEMYPKDRIYAADFGGKPVTLTIKAVEMKALGEGAKQKTLPVWHFEETPKTFPAVKTNGVCARAMFGDDSDEWVDTRSRCTRQRTQAACPTTDSASASSEARSLSAS